MSHEHHPELPHEPAPPEPRFQVPPAEQVVRGAALAALAAGAGWLGVGAFRASWVLAPVTVALFAVAVLAGWAAAIHLTGGEKFDDHPFV